MVSFEGTTGVIYIFPELGWLGGGVERALDSMTSMTESATTMETGEPMAVDLLVVGVTKGEIIGIQAEF